MNICINLAALTLTLAGSTLLFFYGFPSKTVGNVSFYGSLVLVSEPVDGEIPVPNAEWEPLFERFKRKAKIFNRLGFGLIAFGTALQIVALTK